MEKPTLKDAFRYSSFVWLTTIIISPFLYVVLDAVFQNETRTGLVFSFIGFSIFYGGIYSVPGWLVLFLSVFLMNRTSFDVQYKKAMLLLIGFLLIVATFVLFFGGRLEYLSQSTLFYCYCISNFFGLIFYDIDHMRSADVLFEGPLDHY